MHVVEENLSLLSVLGIAREDVGAPVLPILADPVAESLVAGYLEGEGVKPDTPVVALNPGSGGEAKRWAVGAYRHLGDELAGRLGARPLVLWGPGEEPLARAIAQGMRIHPLVPPPTSIAELVALLRRATLVVGGDTGPIHIAGALGVPTLGLYGPTSARRNGPWGPRTATVQSPSRRMDGISVEDALAAVGKLLQ
jgi:ADP-heptose:LPS heptosyltransferase